MNTFKKSLLIAASAGLMFSACSDDSSSSTSSDVNEPNEGAASYVMSFMVGESQFYGTASLEDDYSKVIKNFQEGPASGSVKYFNGALYSLATDESGASTLKMFKLDKDNNLPEKPSKTKSFSSGALMMQFIDKNKMYVIESMGDQLTALNPSDLSVIAEIDLSSYVDEKGGALMAAPGSSVYADGKLFVTLAQFVDMDNGIVGGKGNVVIIDVSKDKVIKHISEENTAALGIYDDMNNSQAFTDEKGDLYFYSNGGMNFVEGYKEGFVRIKKGKEEFDNDYVFHLQDASYNGKESNTNWLMTGGAYAGDGKYVALFGDLSDPTNFNNFEWQYVILDIYEKSIQKVDLSPTLPWLIPSAHLDSDGSVLLGHMDENGASALYRLDVPKNKLTKISSVETGFIYFIAPIAD